MAHAVVNGANGSLTWCSGLLGCPRCDADRELNERLNKRIRRGELVLLQRTPTGYQIVGIGAGPLIPQTI
jgi:hypothetical protein